jgi:RNA polymerase sigma-70 factor (ECF subfamily)
LLLWEEPSCRKKLVDRLDKQAFMRACREGGDAMEHALRALDRALFALLYRDCRRSLRDAEAARDVVQETFIKVWQRCATFRGDSELLPWIKAILRRGILDRLRGGGREVPMEDEETSARTEPRLAALGAGPALPEDDVRARQIQECFERCWRRFEAASPAHAAVMAWIVEDGLSHEEISQLLGRTRGATREFISQCRKRARAHLAEWRGLAFGVGEPS